MAVVTRTIDGKGRLTLGPEFAGQLVTIERVSGEEVRIRKVRPVAKKSLSKLLASVTPGNFHPEVNTGPAVGAEVW